MRELIEKYWIFGLGFFAQALFGLRVLVQWYFAEQKHQSVSPALYWQVSLVASVVFTLYGILRDDIVIVFGQMLAFVIYIRNLQLQRAWQVIPWYVQAITLTLPIAAVLWLVSSLATSSVAFNFYTLVVLGTIGQLLLNARFIYQWFYSERTKASVLPFGFWVITALGSALVIVYAIDRRDPVLLFAQGLGFVAAVRNIQFVTVRSERKENH